MSVSLLAMGGLDERQDEGLSKVAEEGTANDGEEDAGEAELASEEEDAAGGGASQEAVGDVVSQDVGDAGEGMASSETDMGGLDERQEEGAADDEAQYGETE